jgi:hypothetical protein
MIGNKGISDPLFSKEGISDPLFSKEGRRSPRVKLRQEKPPFG